MKQPSHVEMPSNSESEEEQASHKVKSTVLVVDDEPAICWAFARLLKEEGHEVLTASSAEEGLTLATQNRLDLVLLDVRLPNEDGISALPKFLAATDNVPIVVMTAFGDLETAIAAVDNGATDYLTKPFPLEDAIRTCRNALRAGRRNSKLYVATGRKLPHVQKMIGRSPAIQKAFRQIALVANSDLSVLITGETGTGKELVAEAIHRNSRRRQEAYLQIAPVALNPVLVESELFGHVKGAFTDANEDRAGLFELGNGGTILLDEIGDLPMAIQVKLLRVLEQGDYCRVGETKPRRCNVRILAATNSDLPQQVSAGKFREDLYYRLNGLHIHLPPLRERLEDIAPLCEFFLERIEYPNPVDAVTERLLDELAKRPWNGNVRELRNAVEHAAITARGRPLAIEDFPSSPANGEPVPFDVQSNLDAAVIAFLEEELKKGGTDSSGLQDRLLTVVEPAMFRSVLLHTGGNRVKAAEVLGIHRGTLRDRLKHYKIDD